MTYNPDIIPTYNQMDSQWGDRILGDSGLNCRGWGCYCCSISMLMHNFGIKDDPGTVIDKLNAVNGFVDGQVAYDALHKVYPSVTLKEAVWTTAYAQSNNIQKMAIETALRRLQWFVRLGLLPILCVDNVLHDGLPDHAVVLYHAPDDRREWRIKNPDGGRDEKLIDRYGPADVSIFGYRLFIGSPINSQSGGLPGLGTAIWKAQKVVEYAAQTIPPLTGPIKTYTQEIILNILDTMG